MKWISALIITLTLIFNVQLNAGTSPKVPSKTIIISGKVQDLKSNELLAGVKITCENCKKVVYSDLNGRFFVRFEVSSQQDLKLEVSQIGYSTQILHSNDITSVGGNLEINLIPE